LKFRASMPNDTVSRRQGLATTECSTKSRRTTGTAQTDE
jgi:hypothetical protein